MTARVLGPIGMKAIEGRGISAETAVRFGIHTGFQREGEFVPSADGNVVAFPYFEHGSAVNEKYRAPGKKFWQKIGGKKTFWNADALDDPALEDGRMSLIITEGEIDALTAIECGFPLSVSVPDGAPPPASGKQKDDVDDRDGKFEFVYNNRDRIARIKRFIIAVDNDPPGKQLAEELVRRFGAVRCLFVTYPERKKKQGLCKDLNEVMQEYGQEKVVSVINGAQPYPVHGLYRLSDYPPVDDIRTFSTGWATLDKHFRPFIGEFVAVTGIPSHGKSQWCLNLLANLAVLHGWRSAIFSPEMPTVPHLRNKLYGILGNNSHLIEDRFVFIDAEPVTVFDDASDSEPGTLEWIIDKASQAVMRDGIRVLLIDPWNEIEHAKRRDEMLTDYIGRSIRALKRFGRLYGVMVVVICHPTKDVVGKGGAQRTPSLYDCEGSAHWFNKCDHGIVVERNGNVDFQTAIHVAKSRFVETGTRGTVNMAFDVASGRYTRLDGIDDGGMNF